VIGDHVGEYVILSETLIREDRVLVLAKGPDEFAYPWAVAPMLRGETFWASASHHRTERQAWEYLNDLVKLYWENGQVWISASNVPHRSA